MIKNFLLLISLFIIVSSALHAHKESFQSLASRENAEQPFWLIENANPIANVILFAGGKGKLKIREDGIRKTGNFLVRSREHFADAGFTVAVVDKPTDRNNLFFFRTTQEHTKDIQAVIHFLKKRNNKPVWLIGTSRGTISAANVASRLSDSWIKGLVLTSSLLAESNSGKESLQDVSIDLINMPTLFVHHKKDGCYVTLYDDLAITMENFSKTKKRELKTFTGGEETGSNPCKGKSYHGFIGIEDEVVNSISLWIKQNNK